MRRPIDQTTTGTVTSADGTTIGYRRLGQGPSLVLLHGGVNASHHMLRLGRALADAFTVYLADRRGRGMSGPYGTEYSIAREDEDLAAVVQDTGAEYVFGPANGALFALHGAIALESVRAVAAYEPLLLWGGPHDDAVRHLFTTMQQLVRSGRLGQAVAFSSRMMMDRQVDRGQSPPCAGAAIGLLTSRGGLGLVNFLLRSQRSTAQHVAWRELLAGLPEEFQPVLDTEGTLDEYRNLRAHALLVYGLDTDPMFVGSIQALHAAIPYSTVLGLPGLNHDSAQTYGKPEIIAAALRLHFQQ